MTTLRVSDHPAPAWDELCRNSSVLFGSAEWQELLEASLGCQTLYAWDGQGGAAINVFNAGPFSIAYFGFPTGSITGDKAALAETVARLAQDPATTQLTCARIIVSGFADDPGFDAPFVSIPETAITDLQNWDLMAVSKNLRRDIRKSERSGLQVRRIDDPSFGPHLYGIYANTVKRHGGSLRYNSAYFAAVLEYARRNEAVSVYLAELGSDVVGFAVVARHADTAFYLHGGAVEGARHLSPSDLILAQAIAAAKAGGSEKFNFMASPASQPSLVRYKEKWGGETVQQRTYTIRMSAAFPLFKAAEKIYRLFA